MHNRNKPSAWLAGLLMVAWCAVAQAERPSAAADGESAARKFLRLTRDADGELTAMEAAIVRLAPTNPGQKRPVVDLISAVHVAEKGYFELLNQEFKKYDAVLYELVAKQGTRVPKGGPKRTTNIVSAAQNGLKSVLGLEFQLDQIDYTQENLVHADMSPEQVSESMEKRGESVWGMLARMMAHSMAKSSRSSGSSISSEARLLLALFDTNRAVAMKRVMAEQFEEMDGVLAAIEGPNGSTIVSERNKVALKVLREQIKAGKRKIAIFYGAAHMPDLIERLRDDFGLAPVETRWVVAWDLTMPPVPEEPEEEDDPQGPETTEPAMPDAVQ